MFTDLKSPVRRSLCTAAFIIATCFSSGYSLAADYTPGLLTPSFIDEIRFGVHHNDVRIVGKQNEDGVIINTEILFRRPNVHFDNKLLLFFFNPRFHIGGHLNTAGDTSQAYIGATWDYYLTNNVFVEASFGGSIHNGRTRFTPGIDSVNSLGCPVLLRESASAGFEFTKNLRVMITYDHISNAHLCSENAGLDTLGVRFGYKF